MTAARTMATDCMTLIGGAGLSHTLVMRSTSSTLNGVVSAFVLSPEVLEHFSQLYGESIPAVSGAVSTFRRGK